MIDVVVVGGGPAGLAVAGALGRRGRTVAVLERASYERFRPGETLAPETFPLLETLGAWDALGPFLETQVPHRGVRAAWGTGELEDRPSILHPLGHGRHVARARFDALLASWAARSGASVRLDAGTCQVRRRDGGFRVEPARGDAVEGRTFVDASGRGAPAGAKLGPRRWLAFDREVAIVARAEGRFELEYDLVLEAAEPGWWYSAPQAGGALVVALLTDADLVGERHVLEARFRDALAMTTHTRARLSRAELAAPLEIVRADSGVLVADRAEGAWAVGDAEMSFDPLSGIGVARALRGAIRAADEIDSRLRGEPAAPSVGSALERFADYLDRRAGYYELEARWAHAPFWARRRPGPWRDEPITLAPTALLCRGTRPGAAELACVEALLPPRAIASMLEAIDAPTPAHVVLARQREAAPLGDRRLLVALQRLVAIGALTIG
jgi:flavin-dependent dehydrogenase